MSIKNNLDFVKNELSNDEKLIESAFRFELIYKRYKRLIWTLGVVVIFSIIFYTANIFYTNYNAEKYSKVYNALLENTNDATLQDELKNGNAKLYSLFVLQQALQNGNINDLKSLTSDKNALVAMIARYHLGSFERDNSELEKVNQATLGDLAKLQQAYSLIEAKKINEAKLILGQISQDSPLSDAAKIMSHYLITKS